MVEDMQAVRDTLSVVQSRTHAARMETLKMLGAAKSKPAAAAALVSFVRALGHHDVAKAYDAVGPGFTVIDHVD